MSKSKRSGIGGGLDNLIPVSEDFSSNDSSKQANLGKPLEISVSEISYNPHQPRKNFSELGIANLKESIKDKGILEPLIVTKTSNGYELIAGQRRLMAAKAAKIEKVPVIVREKITDEKEKLEIALIENIVRENLNPIEEAESYSKLESKFSVQTTQIGKMVGKDRSTVENTIRLLKLPTAVKEDIISSRLSVGHGKALLTLSDNEPLLLDIRGIILEKSLTVRQTEKLIKSQLDKLNTKKDKKCNKNDDLEQIAYYESLSKQISESLGNLKVNISYTGKNKKVEIIYKKSEDMEIILEKLNIKPF
jgi:ParB family chromosome partitioning protein